MSTKHPTSPHEQTGGIVYFARMCDKIRLHARHELPEDCQPNLGKGFDKRCVDFLHVSYDDVVRLIGEGKSDEEVLRSCQEKGGKLSEEQIEVWNDFMRKRGWKDEISEILQRRLKEGGFENRTDIQTMFDYIDLDEGRDPAKKR